MRVHAFNNIIDVEKSHRESLAEGDSEKKGKQMKWTDWDYAGDSTKRNQNEQII